MDYTYTITEEDYKNAARLASRSTKKQLLIILAIGIILLFAVIFGNAKTRIFSFFPLACGAIGYFATIYIITPFQAKRNYRKYKRIQEPLSIKIKDDGYKIWNSGGESIIKWSDLIKWRENDEYLLLYFAPRLYHLLPKRIKGAGLDIEQLTAKLKKHIGLAI